MKSPSRHSHNDSARCHHRNRGGRRCRQPIFDSSSSYCFHHASQRLQQKDAVDLTCLFASDDTAPNTPDLTCFRSATEINAFLSRLLIQLAQNKVSARRAAVLTYITNQLLRTLPAMAREAAGDDRPPQIIFDLPRPDRSPKAPPCHPIFPEPLSTPNTSSAASRQS